MPIRIVIADDHQVVRSGLVALLSGANFEIVGEAATGEEAINVSRLRRPDVLLLDIRMPGDDGLIALEAIRQSLPDLRVVILSTYDNPTYMARALALGANDYLLKGCSREELVESVTMVAAGERPLRSSQFRRVASAMVNSRRSPDEEINLTQRETQVLRHLALGLSNDEISRSLEISVETVKEHVQHVLRKVGVNGRTQAAVWAVRRGLV